MNGMERNTIIKLRDGLVTIVYFDDPMIDVDSSDEEELTEVQRIAGEIKKMRQRQRD